MSVSAARMHVDVEMSATSPLLIEREAGVTTLTLNRPAHYNALSEELLAALQSALDEAAVDTELRCLIIAGAGKAFCAGHDLKQMRAADAGTERDESYFRALFTQCGAVMQSIQAVPVPVIAQVHGIATAAGCQLVAACDLAVAASSARLAVSGINLGLFCSTPAVALSRNVAPKAAFDMLFTGRFITAERALELGLVNAVVEDNRLQTAVRDYAAEICAKDPAAIRVGKQMFYAQGAMSLADAYDYAGKAMAANMMLAETQNGIDAFLTKSKPK